MEKTSLFRQEAIKNRLNRNLDVIRINTPLCYRITGVFSLMFLLVIGVFVCFAQISARTYIRGYLDADEGIITITADNDGLIHQAGISEGKHVKKGELLFIISNLDLEKTTVLINNFSERIANLKREYQLKKEHYHALEILNEKKYISALTLKNTEAELLEIRNKIQFEKLERSKYKQSQYQFVQSPVDGIITNVFYKPGQHVNATKTLLQIIPDNTTLVARLYIPTKDIGFLKKGAPIVLKYDAYPSQRFGFYPASIKEINLTVLTDDKEEKPIRVGEPYYKIKAVLAQPYVHLYGKKVRLSHGMTLTAVIVGEKKTIWQWIFDPIYSYYGEAR